MPAPVAGIHDLLHWLQERRGWPGRARPRRGECVGHFNSWCERPVASVLLDRDDIDRHFEVLLARGKDHAVDRRHVGVVAPEAGIKPPFPERPALRCEGLGAMRGPKRFGKRAFLECSRPGGAPAVERLNAISATPRLRPGSRRREGPTAAVASFADMM